MRGKIVVIGEIQSDNITPLTMEILGAGKKLAMEMKTEICAILLGKYPEKQNAEILQHYGADEVICMSDPLLEENHVSSYRKAVSQYLKKTETAAILIGGSSFGRILAGTIAFELDTELISDVMEISYDKQKEQIIFTRPAYDGERMADFVIHPKKPAVLTIRNGVAKSAFYHEKKRGRIHCFYPKGLRSDSIDYKKIFENKKHDIYLKEAKIIIAGGRGMKGKDGFVLLEQLANKLGGKVGSTRPCVDAGWTLPSQQIGQSGISVKPDLYLAFGISGAIQHMTGVYAKCLIAINENPEAAIFQFCDYGIVGDARKVLKNILKKI